MATRRHPLLAVLQQATFTSTAPIAKLSPSHMPIVLRESVRSNFAVEVKHWLDLLRTALGDQTPSEDHATGVKTKNNRFQPHPARSDSPEEVSYGETHVLLHGDGPPCPRSAGHGGGGINSIVAGRAASSQMLALFPVTLFSTSVRELDQ